MRVEGTIKVKGTVWNFVYDGRNHPQFLTKKGTRRVRLDFLTKELGISFKKWRARYRKVVAWLKDRPAIANSKADYLTIARFKDRMEQAERKRKAARKAA